MPELPLVSHLWQNTLAGLRKNPLTYSKTVDQRHRIAAFTGTLNAFDGPGGGEDSNLHTSMNRNTAGFAASNRSRSGMHEGSEKLRPVISGMFRQTALHLLHLIPVAWLDHQTPHQRAKLGDDQLPVPFYQRVENRVSPEPQQAADMFGHQ